MYVASTLYLLQGAVEFSSEVLWYNGILFIAKKKWAIKPWRGIEKP